VQAIVRERYGGPEVLEVRDVEQPKPEEGEVLVRVHAAGVDPSVWHITAGLPYFVRLMGYGLRAPKNPVPGWDLAGEVVAAGAGVMRFAPGDAVYGVGRGSWAEYVCAKEDGLAGKPAPLAFEEAAAVPVSGCTALQAVRKGEVEAGQSVLVTGAGGGVGSFTVQLAKAVGARVTAATSTGKADIAEAAGADRVIDRTREDFTAGNERYDVIVDTAGNRPLGELRRVLAKSGTVVFVGGEGGGALLGGFDRQLRGSLLSPFVAETFRTLVATERTRTWSSSASRSSPGA